MGSATSTNNFQVTITLTFDGTNVTSSLSGNWPWNGVTKVPYLTNDKYYIGLPVGYVYKQGRIESSPRQINGFWPSLFSLDNDNSVAIFFPDGNGNAIPFSTIISNSDNYSIGSSSSKYITLNLNAIAQYQAPTTIQAPVSQELSGFGFIQMIVNPNQLQVRVDDDQSFTYGGKEFFQTTSSLTSSTPDIVVGTLTDLNTANGQYDLIITLANNNGVINMTREVHSGNLVGGIMPFDDSIVIYLNSTIPQGLRISTTSNVNSSGIATPYDLNFESFNDYSRIILTPKGSNGLPIKFSSIIPNQGTSKYKFLFLVNNNNA